MIGILTAIRGKGLLFAISLLPLASCGQADDFDALYKHTVPLMSMRQLDSLQHGRSSFHLFDTRTSDEFDVSHISGAVLVPYGSFSIGKLKGIDTSDTVIVYCSVGYRSERIGEKLQKAGFQHVFNLYGGIFNWKNHDGKVVDPQGRPTEKVHAYDHLWGRYLKKGQKVY